MSAAHSCGHLPDTSGGNGGLAAATRGDPSTHLLVSSMLRATSESAMACGWGAPAYAAATDLLLLLRQRACACVLVCGDLW